MGSDASYNERRLLWAAVRFVQAVTGVRANQPAFMPRLASTAGAEDSMGCGTLCASGILRKENPAPQARIACRLSLRRGRGCRLSLPGGPARFYARLPHSRGAEVPMGSDTFYNKRRLLWEVGTLCLGCNLHEDSPAPAALARRGRACRLSLPARQGGRNFKGRGKKSAFGRQKGGRGGGRRLILDLDNTIRQGRGGYFDHTAHQAVRRRI